MITHGIVVFMDTHFVLRRTWCGIDLAPSDPRPAEDEPVDCMTCLVHEARRSANRNGDIRRVIFGRVVSVNPDGSFVMEVA